MTSGIFYEIGAHGAALGYLLEENWQTEARRRESVGEHTYLPEVVLGEIEQWERGIFVDPHPASLAELVNGSILDNPRAIVVQGAVSPYYQFAEVILPKEGTPSAEGYPDMVLLPETNILSKEQFTPGNSFWTVTFDLDMLFEKFGYPDFVRLNLEGAEGQVLHKFSFKQKPRYIQVVSHFLHTCQELLESEGYRVSTTLGKSWWVSLRLDIEA